MKACNIKKSHLNVFSNISLSSKNSRIDFLTKVVLASFIAAIAFITNSQEGVIGSMLISPLGGPIMGLVSALIVFDLPSSLNAIVYLCIGFVLMIIIGMFIGYFKRKQEPTDEMKKRYNTPTIWTLVNGVIIGIVFSIVALSSGSAIVEGVGAGIAISLLPPVVNCGVTYMNRTLEQQERKKNIVNTLLITVLNIIGIIIAASIIFTIHCTHPHMFEWE
jgi:uncharacterized hydrophobic protein (TIGR00271 family)